MTDAQDLKKFRAKFSLTQKAAAEVIGYSDGRVIRRIENGETGNNGRVYQLSGPARRAMQYYEAIQILKSKTK